MRHILYALFLAAFVSGDAADPPPKGSIAGTVENAVSGQPMDGFNVRLTPGGKSVTTDVKGAFQFKDLEPGSYRLVAMAPFLQSRDKIVAVSAGREVSGVRLKFDPLGYVTGKVKDENGDRAA